MAQARGTQLVVALYEETQYGVTPGTPSGQIIPVKSFGLESSQSLFDSETLSSDRARTRPGRGNIDAGGPMVMELGPESMGTILKHAIGQVVTGRSVSTQPTNVTGVEVEYASSGSATGDGTLSYTSATTSLTWAESGDTAGAAVDVSGGGTFTLLSNSGESISVVVTAASLPATDKSDTNITVSSTGYTHTFTIGDLPVGMILEKDHGANISGTGRFEYFNGVKVGAVTFDFPQEGNPTASFTMKGAGSTLAASALDSSLTDNGFTPFSSFTLGTVEEGGATIANITEASLTLDNGLDESSFVLGQRNRQALTEGFSTVTGQIVALFEDATLLNKAINGTESSLKFGFGRGTGDGSPGNESLEYLVEQLEYERKGQPVEGPAGIKITLPFKAYRSGAQRGLRVRLKNAVATV